MAYLCSSNILWHIKVWPWLEQRACWHPPFYLRLAVMIILDYIKKNTIFELWPSAAIEPWTWAGRFGGWPDICRQPIREELGFFFQPGVRKWHSALAVLDNEKSISTLIYSFFCFLILCLHIIAPMYMFKEIERHSLFFIIWLSQPSSVFQWFYREDRLVPGCFYFKTPSPAEVCPNNFKIPEVYFVFLSIFVTIMVFHWL